MVLPAILGTIGSFLGSPAGQAATSIGGSLLGGLLGGDDTQTSTMQPAARTPEMEQMANIIGEILPGLPGLMEDRETRSSAVDDRAFERMVSDVGKYQTREGDILGAFMKAIPGMVAQNKALSGENIKQLKKNAIMSRGLRDDIQANRPLARSAPITIGLGGKTIAPFTTGSQRNAQDYNLGLNRQWENLGRYGMDLREQMARQQLQRLGLYEDVYGKQTDRVGTKRNDAMNLLGTWLNMKQSHLPGQAQMNLWDMVAPMFQQSEGMRFGIPTTTTETPRDVLDIFTDVAGGFDKGSKAGEILVDLLTGLGGNNSTT